MATATVYPDCEVWRCQVTKHITLPPLETARTGVIRPLQVSADLNHWSLRERKMDDLIRGLFMFSISRVYLLTNTAPGLRFPGDLLQTPSLLGFNISELRYQGQHRTNNNQTERYIQVLLSLFKLLHYCAFIGRELHSDATPALL